MQQHRFSFQRTEKYQTLSVWKRYLHSLAVVCLSSICTDRNTEITRNLNHQISLVCLETVKEKVSLDKRSDRVVFIRNKGRPRRRGSTKPPSRHSKEINIEQIYRIMLFLRWTLLQRYDIRTLSNSRSSLKANQHEIHKTFSVQVKTFNNLD